jgi:cytochrome c-type biogenesis protein CcmH
MLSDPALEMRAREISRELRCVVCQNESVDDSPAEVARDIRRAVRERLVAGDTDRQVLDYMVARYGDYVLLQPPFKTRTLILWLGTPLVLLLGAAGLWFAARRRAAMLGPEPLNEAEKERVDLILRDAALRTAPQDEANGATTPPHPQDEANSAATPPHPQDEANGATTPPHPEDEANSAATPPHPEDEADSAATPPHPEERPQGASRRVGDG